uniref:Perforin 1.9 n=1 Tax=Neolamprologus brichardi TaxID=32507 RepID=A0A3Q4GJA3_NEOBR
KKINKSVSQTMFCFCVLLLYSCTEGTPKQCIDAEFAPGANLAGEGAFVLDMNKWKRKDKTCMLCTNPFLENKKQKLPLTVVDWRAKQSCSAKVSTKLHKSSESLVGSSVSSVENNWKVNLDLQVGSKGASLMLAGTNSHLSSYSMEKTKNDKYSFASHSMSCEYYSYRVSSAPKLHREFRKALTKLPKTYSAETKQRFYKLIDDFGTHYITKVKLGGSIESVTSIRQCQASLQGLSAEEVQMCLEVELYNALYLVASELNSLKTDSSSAVMISFCRSCSSNFVLHRFTEIKGGHTTEPDLLFSADKNPEAYKGWLSTLPQNPDIVSYSLDSLHELLPTTCKVRKNLRSAISHYILEKGLWRNCTDHCCPVRKGMARVIITIQRASGLWGDHTTSTDGYVKVIFNKLEVRRSPVIYNNNNPHWGMVVDLGSEDISSAKLRFEVWDEDNKWDDDLLGACDLSIDLKMTVCYCMPLVTSVLNT